MKERRYKEDWINETRFDDRTGREKRVPVYRGEWYRYDEKIAPRRERTAWAVGGCAVYLATLLLWFVLDFPGTRVLYVFLPVALGLFPAAYWIMGIAAMLSAPLRLTRLQKEKGPSRVLRCALACAVFSAMGSLGDLIYMFSAAPPRAEWPGLLLLLAGALAALGAGIRLRGMLRDGLLSPGAPAPSVKKEGAE